MIADKTTVEYSKLATFNYEAFSSILYFVISDFVRPNSFCVSSVDSAIDYVYLKSNSALNFAYINLDWYNVFIISFFYIYIIYDRKLIIAIEVKY